MLFTVCATLDCNCRTTSSCSVLTPSMRALCVCVCVCIWLTTVAYLPRAKTFPFQPLTSTPRRLISVVADTMPGRCYRPAQMCTAEHRAGPGGAAAARAYDGALNDMAQRRCRPAAFVQSVCIQTPVPLSFRSQPPTLIDARIRVRRPSLSTCSQPLARSLSVCRLLYVGLECVCRRHH